MDNHGYLYLCFTCHGRFTNIFWIDASSESAIDLRLQQIGKANKIPELVSAESTLQWISERHDWLMVYDHADSYQIVEKFLPQGNRGNILITSRNRGLNRITSHQNALEVRLMGEDDAVSLLLQSAGLSSSVGQMKPLARKLVLELGYIPLAIDQAGAYSNPQNRANVWLC